jgi:hypothetical protein
MTYNEGLGESSYVDVTLEASGPPTVTAKVLDSTVTLQWTEPTGSYAIIYYEIRRGTTWETATVIGQKQGTFSTVTEFAGGTYVYWVAGIDASFVYGTPGNVTVVVNQPPDFTSQLSSDSTFDGTKVSAVSLDTGVLVNVNLTDTWQSHFTSRGWSTPQNQLDAGFAYFAMPSTTSSSYEETFDTGAVISSTKITATLTSENIAGSTTITPTISTRKLATDAWTNFSGTDSVFVTDFRYAKVKYDFTSTGNNDLLLLTGLNTRMDAKLINDAGNGTAVSTDSGGTTVTFTRSFARVTSISVTPASTSAVLATYSFTDVANPTSFKVLLWNTSGARLSGSFSWTAKGA